MARQEREATPAEDKSFEDFGGDEVKRPPAVALRAKGAYIIGIFQGIRQIDVADEDTGEVEPRDVVDLLYLKHGGPGPDAEGNPSYEVKGDELGEPGSKKPCSLWGTAVIISKLTLVQKGSTVAIRRGDFLPKKGKRQPVDYEVRVQKRG